MKTLIRMLTILFLFGSCSDKQSSTKSENSDSPQQMVDQNDGILPKTEASGENDLGTTADDADLAARQTGGTELGNPALDDDSMDDILIDDDNISYTGGTELGNPLIFSFGSPLFDLHISANQRDDVHASMSRETPQLLLLLTDMPVADESIDQVIVDINGLSIAGMLGDSSGDHIMSVNTGTYDLLTLRDNKTSFLSILPMPSGDFHTLTLTLGEDNYIMKAGQRFDLTVPSKKVQLKGRFTFEPSLDYLVVIDFVVEESLHESSPGKYVLRPVVKIKSVGQYNDDGTITMLYYQKSREERGTEDTGERNGAPDQDVSTDQSDDRSGHGSEKKNEQSSQKPAKK